MRKEFRDLYCSIEKELTTIFEGILTDVLGNEVTDKLKIRPYIDLEEDIAGANITLSFDVSLRISQGIASYSGNGRYKVTLINRNPYPNLGDVCKVESNHQVFQVSEDKLPTLVKELISLYKS